MPPPMLNNKYSDTAKELVRTMMESFRHAASSKTTSASDCKWAAIHILKRFKVEARGIPVDLDDLISIGERRSDGER